MRETQSLLIRVLRLRSGLFESAAPLTPCPPHSGGGALGGMLS
jgi:hypothetical protein